MEQNQPLNQSLFVFLHFQIELDKFSHLHLQIELDKLQVTINLLALMNFGNKCRAYIVLYVWGRGGEGVGGEGAVTHVEAIFRCF